MYCYQLMVATGNAAIPINVRHYSVWRPYVVAAFRFLSLYMLNGSFFSFNYKILDRYGANVKRNAIKLSSQQGDLRTTLIILKVMNRQTTICVSKFRAIHRSVSLPFEKARQSSRIFSTCVSYIIQCSCLATGKCSNTFSILILAIYYANACLCVHFAHLISINK